MPTAEPPRSPKQRMLAGDPYLADDPEIAADGLRCALLVREYNATSPAEPALRAALLRDLLGSVGADTVIRSPLQCDYRAGHRGRRGYGRPKDLPAGVVAVGNPARIVRAL